MPSDQENESNQNLEPDLEPDTSIGSRSLLFGLAAILFLFAFSPIGRALESGSPLVSQFEYWFFDTSGASPGLMACLAAWAAWRRLPRLLGLSGPLDMDTQYHPIGSSLLFLACLGTFIWADLNEAPDLLFISLSLLVASLSFYLGGSAGIRTMALPIVILFLALPIPYPLNSEIVWSLQNWSAAGTESLLRFFGIDIVRSGALLIRGDVFFLVIEGCSGLRSILTLTILSLVIRELFELPPRRSWGLVLAAPFLAIALNIVRIATIVLSSSPSDQMLGNEHLEQGLVVLAIGAVILFVAGHFLARAGEAKARSEKVSAAAELEHEGTAQSLVQNANRTGSKISTRRARLLRLLQFSSAMLAVLCLASVLTKSWPLPSHAEAPTTDVPKELAGWSGTAVELDYPFLGIVPRGFITRREYRHPAPIDRLGQRPVSILIAADSSKRPRGSPVSSKLMVPGRSWQIETTDTQYNYVLGREISVSRARSTDQRALVYSWSLHDDGFWQDSARSFLALERGPFERPRHRVMIQVATFIGMEAEAERHARQILDRFIHDFRKPFRGL